MFKDLIKRQLIEDIMSFKFLINIVLILASVIIFSLIFINNYHNLLDTYSKSRMNNEKILMAFSKTPSSNLEDVTLYCLMEPRTERLISDAYEEKMPQGFLLTARPYLIQFKKQAEEVMYTQISKRELLSSAFSYSPDLTFIIQFLLSFFAIVLTFNAVSAEKENGTLRLVFSNSFKGAYFVLAKYVSAFITICLPLLLGLILSLTLLAALALAPFYSSLVLNFLSFLIISLLYLSVFILIGILCSIIGHSSKMSLVLSLLSWIFLVIIIPKASGMLLSLKRFDVPAEEEIRELAFKAEDATIARMNKQMPENSMKGFDEDRKKERKLRLNYERDKSAQDIYDFYLRKKLSAIKTIRAINYVSPASLFEFSASSMAGTGLSHFENLWQQTRQYGNDFVSFLKDNISTLKKGSYFYPNSDSISNKPIDFNGIPKFEDKKLKLGERMRDALPYIYLLLFYNLFIFIFVLYKFQKYDVR